MKISILRYIACPMCYGNLILQDFRLEDNEVKEGALVCRKCGQKYSIMRFLPILTPPYIKPYDWISVEITKIKEKYGLKEGLLHLIEGKLKPIKPKPGGSLLSQEELQEGEYRESREYWERRLRKIKREQIVSGDLEKIWNIFIVMSGVESAKEVLDVGTGLGAMLTYIADKWPEKGLFALGISYVNLKAVRGKLKYFKIGENVHLVVGDALNMPFKSNIFDVVESWFGLGSIIEFKKVIRQAYRVLKRGGRFTVSGAWGEAYINFSMLSKIIKSLATQEYEKLIKFLREKELMLHVNEVTKTFKEVGFHDIEVFEEKNLYVVTGRKSV